MGLFFIKLVYHGKTIENKKDKSWHTKEANTESVPNKPMLKRTLKLIKIFETNRPFREAEAWVLFRSVAIAEAFGWTCLIAAILLQRYHVHGNQYGVPIAGQIHGTFFIVYFGILLTTYTSLEWSRKKFILSLAAGVVPYGSLLFEMWAHWARNYTHAKQFYSVTVLSHLKNTPQL